MVVVELVLGWRWGVGVVVARMGVGRGEVALIPLDGWTRRASGLGKAGAARPGLGHVVAAQRRVGIGVARPIGLAVYALHGGRTGRNALPAVELLARLGHLLPLGDVVLAPGRYILL